MSLAILILVLATIFYPIYSFFTFGKKLPVLFVPLVLQIFSYVFWFWKIKPWVTKKSNNLSEQKAVIQSSFAVFLVFCVIIFDCILPYCLQQEYLIDNLTILFIVVCSLSIWCLLFCASLQKQLLQLPSEARVYWGKILPLTISAILFGIIFLRQKSKILAVVFIFSVFTLECIASFWYSYHKHRQDRP